VTKTGEDKWFLPFARERQTLDQATEWLDLAQRGEL
jgi:hypothetical protein